MVATYTSVFDDDVVCVSACTFEPQADRVSDIQPAENADEAEQADARTDEFVTLPSGKVLRASDGVVFQY